jgi:hypothetical protein
LIHLRLVTGALKTHPPGSNSSKRLSSTSPRLISKNVLMTVQKDLGNSPWNFESGEKEPINSFSG